MALSDAWLKAHHNKPHEKVLEKADRDGLSARVSAKGKITWQLRFRFMGKLQRCDVGVYPAMGLAEARKECLRFKTELAEGRDPRVVKKVEREANMLAPTFEQLFAQWFLSSKEGQTSAAEIKQSFELHVFPVFGQIPAHEITLHLWLTFLEEQTKARPHIAVRILSNSKLLYRWAVKRDLVKVNPLAEIFAGEDLKVKAEASTRILDAEEIALFYEALEKSMVWPKNKLLMELCLFFGCRVSELRLAQRKHFDMKKKIWTVPWENHKTGDDLKQPIVRPIIDEIVPTLDLLFRQSSGKYLFPHRNEDRPVSNRTHIKIPSQLTEWVRVNKGISMTDWCTHDLRRTARSNWSALTKRIDIPEIMLGHQLKGVQKVYDHYEYLTEQAEVYRAWFDRLQRIRYPERYKNIVDFKQA